MKARESPDNYQRMMERVLAEVAAREPEEGPAPTLLLHSCCAPCSTAAITALAATFRITVFYYNPNIDEREEYARRAREQASLISRLPTANPVTFLEGDYDPARFLELAKGHEADDEGGARCGLCFALRLEETAKAAKAGHFDWFATTLTLSPLKDAARINEIGCALAERYGVAWLWSDFKKKDGYRRSVELSKEYGLYRQDYCGCSFSKRARDRD